MVVHARVLLAFVGFAFLATTVRAEGLTIGSPAPAIEIEHWFHGKKPISSFEKGRVYVVEFWATWCGPCIMSMPHVAEIQKRHADDLTVIGVSDEDPETIESFLDREREGTTFREITSAYWLTTDPDKSTSRDYMQAAGQNGIPTAFIVGKEGEIEWIGHPGSMDEPIAKVLAGEWDREAFAAEWAEEKLVRGKAAQIQKLMRANKFKEALALFDEVIAEVKTKRIRDGLVQGRKRVEAEAQRADRVATAQAAMVTALLEYARHLEAGNSTEAAATLERVIKSTENEDVKRLLEEARSSLKTDDDSPP